MSDGGWFQRTTIEVRVRSLDVRCPYPINSHPVLFSGLAVGPQDLVMRRRQLWSRSRRCPAAACAPNPPCGLRVCDIREAPTARRMAAAAAACLRGVDPVAVPVTVVPREDFIAQAAATPTHARAGRVVPPLERRARGASLGASRQHRRSGQRRERRAARRRLLVHRQADHRLIDGRPAPRQLAVGRAPGSRERARDPGRALQSLRSSLRVTPPTSTARSRSAACSRARRPSSRISADAASSA